ncbi:hypothetical protein GC177_02900 [bacterium]|nr:hypothetical protein [bacterium]
MPDNLYQLNVQLAPSWDGSTVPAPIIVTLTDPAGYVMGQWNGKVSGQGVYYPSPGLRGDLDGDPSNANAFYPFIHPGQHIDLSPKPYGFNGHDDAGNSVGFYLGTYTDKDAPDGWGLAEPGTDYVGHSSGSAIGIHPDEDWNGTNGCFGLYPDDIVSFATMYNSILDKGGRINGVTIQPRDHQLLYAPDAYVSAFPPDASSVVMDTTDPVAVVYNSSFASMTYEGDAVTPLDGGQVQSVSYNGAEQDTPIVAKH